MKIIFFLLWIQNLYNLATQFSCNYSFLIKKDKSQLPVSRKNKQFEKGNANKAEKKEKVSIFHNIKKPGNKQFLPFFIIFNFL